MLIFSTSKWMFLISATLVEMGSNAVYMIDMVFVNEKISYKLRNTIILSLFLLESGGLMSFLSLNYLFQGWRFS